jgi:hypothetical protein
MVLTPGCYHQIIRSKYNRFFGIGAFPFLFFNGGRETTRPTIFLCYFVVMTDILEIAELTLPPTGRLDLVFGGATSEKIINSARAKY